MKLDPIATVEACYDTRPHEDRWLGGVLETLRPLDLGMGLYAEAFDLTAPSGHAVERRAQVGALPEGVMDDGLRACLTLPPDLLRRFFSPAPPANLALRWARSVGGEVAETVGGFFRRWGVRDALGMFAVDADGRALMVGAPIPSGERLPSARVLRQLERVSAHLVSGFRLRRALGGRAPGPDDAEAVLDPGGHLLHATGGARARDARGGLVEAVRRSERARGRLRVADPEEALALWKGLIDGTWSLLDHGESDGRRLVLARRNSPGVSDPKALTLRERAVLAFAAMGHQNKYIAYLLGLAPSTVAAQLRSACRKLGLGSRREAIETFAALVDRGEREARPPAPTDSSARA